MERLLATFACATFIAKVITNVLCLGDAETNFVFYDTDLSPADSPLLLCRASFSFPYTAVLVLYCVVTTFQKNNRPKVVSSKFYAAFSVACVFEAVYIGLWAKGFPGFSFLLICMASIIQYLALYCAYTGLQDVIERESELKTSTIRYNRVLVQSGLIFDCAWNAVLVIIHFAIALCYNMGLSSFQASVIGLLVLAGALIIWFAIENLLIEKYVRFTVSEYIAISIALTSLLSRDRKSESFLPILLLSLMAMVLVLLFSRIFVIMCLENKRKNQEQMYTMVDV